VLYGHFGFALSLNKWKSIERGFHGASVDVRKATVDAKGVKEILRITVLVADFGDLLKARGDLNGLVLIRDKVRHYRERGSYVINDVQDFAIATKTSSSRMSEGMRTRAPTATAVTRSDTMFEGAALLTIVSPVGRDTDTMQHPNRIR